MRILFMGTPEAAVPTLQRCLADGHEVVAVYTQPDRPAGRGKKINVSPVKELALSHELPVYQPRRLKDDETKSRFASHKVDVAVVVAYGRILPEEYLRAPHRGCINVHFSLLPLYRGAAPVNWAIVNGEVETGVTTMFIEPELDSGPILLQHRTRIGERETAPELMRRLANTGAELLGETLRRLHEITPRPQHDRDATFAPLLKKEDGHIDWSKPAEMIERCVRGFQPWPNAYTTLRSHGLTVWRAEPVILESLRADSPFRRSTPYSGPAGQIIAAEGDDLLVQCGEDTLLRVLEVQPEAKRRMAARDLINGFHLKAGERFGKP